MKYIVSWILITMVQIPCPDADKKDEFGRISMTNCSVNHCRIERDTLYKYFSDGVLAREFYLKAKKEFEATIDSIKIGNQ